MSLSKVLQKNAYNFEFEHQEESKKCTKILFLLQRSVILNKGFVMDRVHFSHEWQVVVSDYFLLFLESWDFEV
jgi:hypothetical protein